MTLNQLPESVMTPNQLPESQPTPAYDTPSSSQQIGPSQQDDRAHAHGGSVGSGYGGPISVTTSPRPTIARPLRPQRNNRTTPRGSGFTERELESLLDLLQKFLPLCKDEWYAVLAEHS